MALTDRPGRLAARVESLDVLRGLAVGAMVVDHLALFAEVPLLRMTVGRVAMPLFFLLAGHLAWRRWSWRYARLGALGLALPLLAPWVDSPNVLLWLAFCLPLVAWLRRSPLSLGLVVVVAVTVAANRRGVLSGAYSYDPLQLLALCSLGALIPRAWFVARAGRRPRWAGPVAAVGRAPLRWYVGHVLLLTWLL